jgi:hypothetical protein
MMWLYRNAPYNPTEEDLDPKKVYAFVYLIEDLDTDRKYIGKKVMFFKGYKSVKKKRKRTLKESDWRDYYGSSDILNEEVAKRGKDRFRRTILHLCPNKATANYLEAMEQFARNAILDTRYYNEQIRVRVSRGQLRALKDISSL